MRRTAALFAILLVSCGEQTVELYDACAACGEGGVVDLALRDPTACGPTARHCEDDEYCVAGACVCRPPLTLVGDDCVDTRADPEHCGGPGMACPLCVDGACGASCPAGTMDCEGGCVNVRSHPLHCGECGRPCGADELCLDGLCVDFVAAPCTSCPCGCAQACCAYPEHPSDVICLEAAACF